MDGVRVTAPLRTLIDVIAEGAIATELQAQAVDQALRRGLVVRGRLCAPDAIPRRAGPMRRSTFYLRSSWAGIGSSAVVIRDRAGCRSGRFAALPDLTNT